MVVRRLALPLVLALLVSCTYTSSAWFGSSRPARETPCRDPILFTREGDVYTVCDDGTGIRRLTTYPEADQGAVWSPDGRRIAFVRDVDERPGSGTDYGPTHQRWDIVIMLPDGSGVEQLTDDRAEEASLAWSPDGTRIAYSRSVRREGSWTRSIWTVDVVSGSKHRLLNLGRNSGAYAAAWSPDGDSIAFAGAPPGCRCDRMAVWIARSDGSAKRVLVRGGASGATNPAWSPDGRRIVFMYGYYSQWDLFTAAADGSTLRRLTDTRASEEAPAFTADGRTIVYEVDGDLFSRSARGGKATQITEGSPFDYAPDPFPTE